MSDVRIPQDERATILSWMVTRVVAYMVFYLFALWDLFSRIGGPLILVAHWQTFIWLVAYAFILFSGWLLTRMADRILDGARHESS